MKWSYHSFECAYDFLGGYQYLDNCGKLLTIADQELGYSVNVADQQKAQAVKTSNNLVVNFSPSKFSLHQEEPDDSGETIVDNFISWSRLFVNLISPSSFEKLYVKIGSIYFTKTEDEIFELTRRIPNQMFDEMSDKIGMPKLMQDIGFRFKSGTTQVDCNVLGINFSPKVFTQKPVPFFSTRRQKHSYEQLNNLKNRKAGFEYRHGLLLNMTLFELEPITPCEKNEWNAEYIDAVFKKTMTTVDSVKGLLGI